MKMKARPARSRSERLARMGPRRLNKATPIGEMLQRDDVAVVRPQTASGVDRATFSRGDYGRIVRPDGTEPTDLSPRAARHARGASAALRCGRDGFRISHSSVRLADGGLAHRALETDRRDVT